MDEITLFDGNGNPIAYIQTIDGTIFLFLGEPVAYLDDATNIYGFNGNHLGWFQEGIVWDHQGCRIGFISQASPTFTKFEPFKSFKQFQPFKSFKQFAPFQPFKSTNVARIPFEEFLRSGR
jgi:hypothetical protein